MTYKELRIEQEHPLDYKIDKAVKAIDGGDYGKHAPREEVGT